MPTIAALLAQPQNLPNVPEVVRALIQTFHHPSPDLMLIAHQVAKDPVISAKLLRLANAAQFGNCRQIATVKEAVIRLGTETIRNMVLACGLTDSLKRVPGIELHHFWGKVFDVATLSKQLARRAGAGSEEIFTCGLLYDLGRLIMHLSLPSETIQRIGELEPLLGRAYAEQTVVGFSYAELGAEVANRWCFPLSICEAIRYHPTPLDSDSFSSEAAFIHQALALTNLATISTEEPAAWPHGVANRLGLDWIGCREDLYLSRQNGHGFAALLAA